MELKTPLYDTLAGSGARMGEYRGVQTALGWGNAAAEFTTLYSGCAVYDLGWRAKLTITGEDRVRWMNGMVTNNIRDLALNFGSYNFLLNAQGRIQADLYVYNRGEHLLVDTDAWQASKLLETFNKYIIMDDVEVSDTSGKLTSIGVSGKKAATLLQSLGLKVGLQALQVLDTVVENVGVSLVRSDLVCTDKDEGYEIWMSPDHAATVWKALVRAGAQPVGAEAVELARVAAGLPRYGQDIRERDLPQETEQSRALNFQKGCYVGQEIVERIHSRGQVHRKFTGFRFTGAAPAPGAKIESNGKEVGEITSVVMLPLASEDRTIGLGYIRREVGVPGAEVTVNGARATVSNLPFESI
ncbi:MAG TPA: glycine cleavage T C-terminal barrel domain-containing protein [Terriglobales bacterium]|nr:glycine cleavage T C-terminal barrel domain-containing protein [Terriglobales bacterium]